MTFWPLQKAVYQALAADAAVRARLGDPPRLYDHVPPAAAFPYATLGEATETDWSTDTDTGTEIAFTLNVWSRARGSREAAAIAQACRAVLHDAALTPEAATLVNLRHLSTRLLRDPDGKTRHAHLTFRAVLEPVP